MNAAHRGARRKDTTPFPGMVPRPGPQQRAARTRRFPTPTSFLRCTHGESVVGMLYLFVATECVG